MLTCVHEGGSEVRLSRVRLPGSRNLVTVKSVRENQASILNIKHNKQI